MKSLTTLIALFYSIVVFGQNSINEIQDSVLKKRIIFIRQQTDSFLLDKVGFTAYKSRLTDFSVTFMVGEFAKNYLFLNKEKNSPHDINNLIQHYAIDDNKIKLNDTLGIYYDDGIRKEIRFATVVDSIKAIAIKKLYEQKLSAKIVAISKKKDLRKPFVKIVVDKKSLTYFILLKDKESTHNYSIE